MFSTTITDKLVIHTSDSAVTVDGIVSAMRGWFDHSDFNPETPVLWDFRFAEFDLASAAIEELADRLLELTNEKRSGYKTAWLFGSSIPAQVAVELLSKYDWQNRVRIFQNDYEAAVAWLTSIIK